MKDYANLYHCNECGQVFHLEETDHKITRRCPNCGTRTHFKIKTGEGRSMGGTSGNGERQWMECDTCGDKFPMRSRTTCLKCGGTLIKETEA